MTAFVGHSGSGKSTLLNLIPRIYDPTEGKVLFDGQNIKNLNLKSIRKEISIVDQNTTLFDDTVFNNIKYAKPESSKEEIFKAAIIRVCEFINKLDKKFDTIIGENRSSYQGKNKEYL